MALYAKSNPNHPSSTSAMLCGIDSTNDCNNNNSINNSNNYDQLQASLVANAFDNPQLHSTAQFLLQQQSMEINNDIGMTNNMMTSSNNDRAVLQSPHPSLQNKGLESTLVSQEFDQPPTIEEVDNLNLLPNTTDNNDKSIIESTLQDDEDLVDALLDDDILLNEEILKLPESDADIVTPNAQAQPDQQVVAQQSIQQAPPIQDTSAYQYQSNQIQETLRRASQDQIQQFCLVQQQIQQEKLKLQLLALANQQQQQIQCQPPVISSIQLLAIQQQNAIMMARLQGTTDTSCSSSQAAGCSTSQVGDSHTTAFQGVTATSNVYPMGTSQHQQKSTSGKIGNNHFNSKIHVPLKPNKKKKKRIRPTHCPRSDNTSKLDKPKKKKKSKQTSRRPSFHYVNVIGGGTRPRSSSLDTDQVTTTTSTLPSKQKHLPSVSPLEEESLPSSSPDLPNCSLQDYLTTILSSRGYTPTTLPASELGYHQDPTPLQLASFGYAVCSSIKPNGADRLNALLQAGLSPNPTNKFGDSPFFVACKRGLSSLVQVFIDNGASVRVADSFGRTPLHHALWANPPCLESARLLLKVDPKLLLVKDIHGKCPLDFVVGDEFRVQWIEFLDSIKDEIWPDNSSDGTAAVAYFPEFGKESDEKKGEHPVLSVEMAEKVASGHVMPHEARR